MTISWGVMTAKLPSVLPMAYTPSSAIDSTKILEAQLKARMDLPERFQLRFLFMAQSS